MVQLISMAPSLRLAWIGPILFAFMTLFLYHNWSLSPTLVQEALPSPPLSTSSPDPVDDLHVKTSSSSPAKLTAVVHDAPSKHTATVIFIHGLGDSGAGWAPVGEQLSEHIPHVKFIFPNAPAMPVTLNYGMLMPSWYDIKSLSGINQDQDEAGLLRSRQQIMQIIREEIEQNGIPANRIVLGGFSQGCVVSLMTFLTAEYKFAGLVSLSGYMPLHNKIMNMAADANRKTPIFWGHGDADQVVRYEYGKQSVELLQKNKYNVDFKTYARLGHGSSPQEVRDLLQFLMETVPEDLPVTSKA